MTGTRYALPAWPCYLGEPEVKGIIRCRLEDFQVQEIPSVRPSGEGSHLWLEIEKRDANTHWVAEQLSANSGVTMRDIGYAGMKDRHGVTSQWFSVALQEARSSDWKSWAIPGVTILQALNHPRKLKRGILKGNRFLIVVRKLEGSTSRLEQRIKTVQSQGVPNYFGRQRFGFGGGNIERGARWLEQGGRLPRNKRGIYISAIRSFIFNHLLARRVRDGSWNRILDGEIAMLNGSHSLFECTMPDPVLAHRAVEFDIHPTAPLAGQGGMCPQRQAALLENESLLAHSELVLSLQKAGASADRRALRVLPGKLQWELNKTALSLSFELPPGSYATSLLRELVSCRDHNHISET